MVFCPNPEAITELKEDDSAVTYTKDHLMKYGFTVDFQRKIQQASRIIRAMYEIDEEEELSR